MTQGNKKFAVSILGTLLSKDEMKSWKMSWGCCHFVQQRPRRTATLHHHNLKLVTQYEIPPFLKTLIWKPHAENVSLDWNWILNTMLNTAYFSFLSFLFVTLVIALKILGCDC